MLTCTFLETGGNSVFGVSTFTALSVIGLPGQCHSFCPSKPLSHGLTQSKTLDCGGRAQHPALARAPINLTSVKQSWFYFQGKTLGV